MRSIFKSFAYVAAAAAVLVSCNKEMIESTPEDDSMVEITLKTGEFLTKTQLDTDGKTPLWSKGDVIGVCTETKSSNLKFLNKGTTASATTTFKGSIPTTAQTLYAYSPYTENDRFDTGEVKIDIPNIQYPTSASFDPKADILCAESLPNPVTFDGSTLRFARLTGILKVILTDTDNKLSGEKLVSLKVSTNDKNVLLTGRSKLHLVNRTLSAPYYSQSQAAEANYAEDNRFAIDGTTPVYLGVVPQDIPAGTVLTIEGETEQYLFSKSVTLQDIYHIYAGKFSVLNVSLTSSNISEIPSGLPLPFEDDMSWATLGSNNISISDAPNTTAGQPMYSQFTNVYFDAEGMKVGKSSGTPYVKTEKLNLSKPFSVVVNAKYYGSDNTKMKVMIDDDETTAQTVTLTATMTQYILEFPAAQKISYITFTKSSGKRFYLNGLSVLEGHNVTPTPVVKPALDAAFATSDGGFTQENVTLPNGSTFIWSLDKKNKCMKASAYVDGKQNAGEAYLISPLVDLTGRAAAKLTFLHACNFFTDIATAKNEVSVVVREGNTGTWQTLNIPNWPTKLEWKFVSSGAIDLSSYANKKIQIAFRYTSTATKSGTWEIKNVKIN